MGTLFWLSLAALLGIPFAALKTVTSEQAGHTWVKWSKWAGWSCLVLMIAGAAAGYETVHFEETLIVGMLAYWGFCLSLWQMKDNLSTAWRKTGFILGLTVVLAGCLLAGSLFGLNSVLRKLAPCQVVPAGRSVVLKCYKSSDGMIVHGLKTLESADWLCRKVAVLELTGENWHGVMIEEASWSDSLGGGVRIMGVESGENQLHEAWLPWIHASQE